MSVSDGRWRPMFNAVYLPHVAVSVHLPLQEFWTLTSIWVTTAASIACCRPHLLMTAAMPAPTQAPTVPLHRIRFFDHTPSPITALSFAPIPLPPARDPSTASANANANVKGKAREGGTAELGVLVVARENGEVEIWQYVPADEGGMGNWVLSKVRLFTRSLSANVRRCHLL